ncbi:WD40 repeat domain-containing serine/threonine protein kinase [Actinomadura rupiterrae]|uniref:WD40 repeat domain-containing serine/threonine protein kinase n=1 Tax=Actinomadura rupiterrae TaxID=559627 RepID=UPI0020A2BF40|nr:serine/threonine-protein kinase [Actinomadura rupiterrae]MCP2341415.1 serine/threonine protein kinase [Actinomadura rupiterrae]
MEDAVDIGTVLGGKYRLERRLGRGGMGEVWAGTDEALGRPVAVKIVLAGPGPDPGLQARLRLEARTAAVLQHPGITVVHDVGEHDGSPYFVMELLDGRDLAAVLAEQPGGLPLDLAVDLVAQVADALAYAHENKIVHRDVKPANIMRLTRGGVKLCDFGIALYTEASTRITVTGGVLGTPAYLAPELWEGEPAGSGSDLYALGATLHALLAGGPPFPGPTPAALVRQHLAAEPPRLRTLRPETPAELDDLVWRLLAKSPADRPESAAQVADHLQALRTRLASPAAQPVPQRGPFASTPPQRGHVSVASKAEAPRAATPAAPARPFGTRLAQIDTGHTARISSLVFGELHDRPIAVSVALDHTARVWDLTDLRQVGRPLPTGRYGEWWTKDWVVAPLALDTSGPRTVAVIVNGGSLDVWDLASGTPVGQISTGHTKPVTAVALSRLPDGRPIAVTTSRDTTVRLFDLMTGGPLGPPLAGHRRPVRDVAAGDLNGLPVAVTAGDDWTVRIWDLVAQRQVSEPLTPPGRARILAPADPPRVALHRVQDRTVALAAFDNALHTWDLFTRHPIGDPIDIRAEGLLATGRSGGRPVAFTVRGGQVLTFDLTTLQRTGRPFKGHMAVVSALASGEIAGHPVAMTAAPDHTLSLWSTAAETPTLPAQNS